MPLTVYTVTCDDDAAVTVQVASDVAVVACVVAVVACVTNVHCLGNGCVH